MMFLFAELTKEILFIHTLFLLFTYLLKPHP